MTLDENALRAAGLPASLISLLVSITRAGERAQAAANNAAIANDLAPQLEAALLALDTLEIAPDLDGRIRDAIERLSATEASVSAIGTTTTALAETLAALPSPVVGLEIEGQSLVLIMADGTRVTGPLLPSGGGTPDPDEEAAPGLVGGFLQMDDDNLVIVPPVIIRGNPTPELVLISLTRDGENVLGEIEDGIIPQALPGFYEAMWAATNGILPAAVRTATETITQVATAPAQFTGLQWSVETGSEPGSVALAILERPNNGGSALTDFEYTASDGDNATGISLGGTEIGPRTVLLSGPSVQASLRVRAVNSIAPGPWSLPKTATSGAATQTPRAPEMSGGSLTMDGDDLVITAPAITAGSPTPTVAFSLVRDGADVVSEIAAGRIPGAAVGYYVATWTASNGILPNATLTTALTIAAPATPQIVVADGVVLPTGNLFDGMSLDGIPGYSTLSSPASYASTDPEGGVGTITFGIDGEPVTSNAELLTGGVLTVTVAGTNGETELTHTVGTVQWTYTVEVNSTTNTVLFTDNPAAPDAMYLSIPATIGGEDFTWTKTLQEIRLKPVFADGYPRLVTPDKPELAAVDTIGVGIGPIITVGSLTILSRLTRNGSIDPDVTGTSYQITAPDDYDTALGFNVLLTDARGVPSIGSTDTVTVAAPVVSTTEPQFVGTGVAGSSAGSVAGEGAVNVVPPSHENGDLLVMAVSTQGNTPTPDLTAEGWALLAASTGTNSSNARLAVYTRTAIASTPSVSWTPERVTVAQIFAFRSAAAALAVATPNAGTGSDLAVSINGGAAGENGLILALLATRGGDEASRTTGAANVGMQEFAPVDDARTLAGNDASLSSWVGRVPDGSSTIPATTATMPVAKQWAGGHINITVSA